MQCERQRQQNRHAVNWPEAGQQADDGADEAANQRNHQVRRRHRHGEALRKINPGIHRLLR
jgi:hypothetical protein